MKRPFSILSRGNRAPDSGPTTADERPHPDRTTYVVGDLHGRADLLEPLLTRIDEDIGASGAQDPQLVFVGNYVDHGPYSAELLARMRDLTGEFADNVACLMGNHERMMLDFLTDPALRGPRWMRSGGLATLRSFGVASLRDPGSATPEDHFAAARDLAAAMPEGLDDWIAGLPLTWNSGNLWVVHAAADPQHPMTGQSARVLLWGHPEFGGVPRSDGIWVAHGHTETEAPVADDGRINVNTAAWRSGCLTACAIRPDGETAFLQITG